MQSLASYSFQLGQEFLAQKPLRERKDSGQFLTAPIVARFMAAQMRLAGDRISILDPAAGSGVLACAVIDALIERQQMGELVLDAYEIDLGLCEIAYRVLKSASEVAAAHGIDVRFHIHEKDFVLDQIESRRAPLFQPIDTLTRYDGIVANPPYFKLNSRDARLTGLDGEALGGHTNIYTLFMALAVKLLSEHGTAVFIVPRSFCSGTYFSDFRSRFISQVHPVSIHLFDSREDAFKSESVLQENVILAFKRNRRPGTGSNHFEKVMISVSTGASDLDPPPVRRDIPRSHFLGTHSGRLFFRLPVTRLDEEIIDLADSWSGSLSTYGLSVSTGPVVPFRATELLTDKEEVEAGAAVPLLWMHHIRRHRIEWPGKNGRKPLGIQLSDEARPLLVHTQNCVLVRRFSAKEEQRRLVAAPLLACDFDYEWMGLENHLNYICAERGLETDEVVGLSALLNSSLLDRYFRILNGNTQVNATELRVLPLPPLEVIREVGRILSRNTKNPSEELIDTVVNQVLWKLGHLSGNIPILRETRTTMGKIEEAQQILKALRLPAAQQNEISALTLLALAGISEKDSWRQTRRDLLRIHDILGAIQEKYGRAYAENTRETIRKQVVHQLRDAAIVEFNPDKPDRPTNSPRYCYALTDSIVHLLRTYGTPEWADSLAEFMDAQGLQIELYQRSREQHQIPLKLPDGEGIRLSPGEHNALEVAVVNDFGPRFAPGAVLLYIGDAADKMRYYQEEALQALGVSLSAHDKLPDVILYDQMRNWLFLIEAVTSVGPINPKRLYELEELFADCTAEIIYVTAFPSFVTFKQYASDIAWETEVWVAEMPDHLIHFNGDRFLGPRRSR